MSIINNNLLLAGTDEGYNLTRSLRFRSSASAYLSRTPASAGNRSTWTWSGWVKRGGLGTNQVLLSTGFSTSSDSTFALIGFNSSDNFTFSAYTVAWRTTTQVFRDPSSWYHIIVAFDTTQATAANRVKIYVNGTQVTAFSVSNDPTLNTNYGINQAATQTFGYPLAVYGYPDQYLAETYFIDGQALTPSSFGETDLTTGVWKPKRYAGTYGTNGFYLPFTDNSALTTSSNAGLGKDFSGNGNYWTTNNISITAGVTYDSMTDVPTLTSATAANFAVLNPLDTGSNITLSAANLQTSQGASAGISKGTIGVSSGKWYWEVTLLSGTTSVGIANVTSSPTQNYVGQSSTSYGYYSGNGNKYNNASGSSYGASYTTNDVIGVALDLDAGTLVFYKNNSSQGTAFSSLSGTFVPAIGNDQSNTTAFNAGQRPFAYTPPSGYVALNTYNLPDSTIKKGNTVMDATLWNGNGSTQNIVNAAPFRPDLVWLKIRSAVGSHRLLDSVRGATNALSSNLTNAEFVDSTGLTAFNSSGFTLGADGSYNGSGSTYIGWQWQAGQGTTSSNTNGSITSTVSVNASAGFSVVTYTGTGVNATVGHGLGVAPSLIIVKARNQAYNWNVYSASLANTQFLRLNTTDSVQAGPTLWNSTSPTSSVFSLGTSLGVNGSGDTHVAYCFAPIAGYSAFGSYTGNGSTDGPFIYTGFRPKFVMVKVTSTTNWWIMFDSTRNPYNAANFELAANLSDAEYTANTSQYTLFDFLSNGFKLRTGSLEGNSNGQTYIYMAFAENPFKNSLAR